jgi:hypothetical protein
MTIEQGNVFKGLLWGILLGIPLWISLFGWSRILLN